MVPYATFHNGSCPLRIFSMTLNFICIWPSESEHLSRGTFDLFYICPCHSWCLNIGSYLKLKWSKCWSLPRASQGNLGSGAFLWSALSLPPEPLHWETVRGSCTGISPDALLSHPSPEAYVNSPFWVCELVCSISNKRKPITLLCSISLKSCV